MYQIIIGTPQGELTSKLYSDLSLAQSEVKNLYSLDYPVIELDDGRLFFSTHDLVSSYYFFVVEAS